MITIRPILETDRQFVVQALKNLWGSEKIVYHGEIFNGENLPGFLASEDKRIIGLITYFLKNDFLQIISLNSLTPGRGIGTALIEKVKETAEEKGLQNILVVTTNDNTSALAFYKKIGFTIKHIKKGAVAHSRKIKPEIPLLGENGVPIEDEIELELPL